MGHSLLCFVFICFFALFFYKSLWLVTVLVSRFAYPLHSETVVVLRKYVIGDALSFNETTTVPM
jgi:hypothetical protein